MGATAGLPFVKYVGIVYGAYVVPPMAHPMMMWVDGIITVLARGEDRPTQGVLVDQRTYFQGVLQVSVPARKSSTGPLGTPHPCNSPPRQP